MMKLSLPGAVWLGCCDEMKQASSPSVMRVRQTPHWLGGYLLGSYLKVFIDY